MKYLWILFTIIMVAHCYSPQGSTSSSRFTEHKNFKLLTRRGVCGVPAIVEKVWGGNATALDEYPWMALLQYSNNGKPTGFQCAGSLISDRYVVTAAHCVEGLVGTYFGDVVSVRFGEHDLSKKEDCVEEEGEKYCSDPPVNIEPEEVIPHPSYDDFSQNKFDDIALIRLKTPVNFTSYVTPICLPLNNEQSPRGSNLTVAGWGVTEKKTRSNVKLQAILPVMTNEDCARAYAKESVISSKQICAGGTEGIDSCQGDSGGPLMSNFPGQFDFYLEGVVSYGLQKCGLPNVPGVYTRVEKYVDWILDNMKP